MCLIHDESIPTYRIIMYIDLLHNNINIDIVHKNINFTHKTYSMYVYTAFYVCWE